VSAVSGKGDHVTWDKIKTFTRDMELQFSLKNSEVFFGALKMGYANEPTPGFNLDLFKLNAWAPVQ
jgi:hypothetical protein